MAKNIQGVLTETEPNGNNLTKIMHLLTVHELQKMHVRNICCIERIVPEQNVLLENSRGKSEREGRFDFLVQTKNGKTIGIEVLSRPTQGKMKEKLSYAKEVDEFVFSIPLHSFDLYRREKTRLFKLFARKKFFDKEFADKKITAWLLDTKNGVVAEKGNFCDLFNVKP